MPDKEHEDLEKELRDLGPRIKYPPTPDVARTVRRRLDAEPTRRRGLRAFVTPGWVAAAAATILLSLTVLPPAIRSTGPAFSGASGGAGQAGGGEAGAPAAAPAEHETEPPRRFEGAGASGEVSDEASAGAAAGASAAASAVPGSTLEVGERIPASAARARMGKLLLPETPELSGGPGAVYARGPSGADGVVVVFGPGPGLPPLGDTDVGILLVEVHGDLESAYPPVEGAYGARPEEVDVGGRRGYWLPDGRLLRSPPGDDLPGGALLWEQKDTALLMRANVTREEAIRIAGTIR